jgi:hypothetical protein
MSLEELATAFRHVCDALLPGGGFLFDMNVLEGYARNWRGSYGIVEDDHVCVARSSYSEEERIGRIDFTLFRLDGEWRRSDLTLRQRCYEEQDVCAALMAAGFPEVQVFDAERRPAELSDFPRGRAFFLARKGG